MKRIAVLSGAAILLFHFVFLFLYTNIDGYFYWAIGRYLTTGTYPFIAPFLYSRPTTVSPPLYGIAIALIGILPSGTILLHLVHIALFASGAFLLYVLLTPGVSAPAAAVISLLFLLFPVNLIYSVSMMTELPAQTAFLLYLVLFTRFIQTKRIAPLAYAVVLAACMSLLKYQFIVLFCFSVLLLLRYGLRRKRSATMTGFSLAAGLVILGCWVLTNHAVTGVWGLSDTKLMPFYTNFVWDGRHFPSEQTPAVRTLRRFVPKTVNPYAEYWDLQDYILPKTGRSWHALDTILGNVGIAAIRQYPFDYLESGIRVFFRTLTARAPFWHNLETEGGRDPVQPLYCGNLGTIRFCRPLIMTPWTYPLWDRYVSVSRTLYAVIMPPLFLCIFLPSLLFAFFDPQPVFRWYAVLYLVSLVPISYLAMTEPRYLIPYYPLMVILSVRWLIRASEHTGRKRPESLQ
ncbi:hypothetical protein M1555_03140 [Patescibacteria group bacterium]|nr:hypothetical protein [Patescibacteria group bacterium]